MRNAERYLTDKCLCAPTGGVYFEASARENHEGVHTAFMHLCQEVGVRYHSFIALNADFVPFLARDVHMMVFFF